MRLWSWSPNRQREEASVVVHNELRDRGLLKQQDPAALDEYFTTTQHHVSGGVRVPVSRTRSDAADDFKRSSRHFRSVGPFRGHGHEDAVEDEGVVMAEAGGCCVCD